MSAMPQSGRAGATAWTSSTANPWSIVPPALEQLQRHGGPPEAGLRIAEALAALGLQEPAAVWARAVAQAVSGDAALGPRLVAVAKKLESLSASAINTEELIARARANLAASDDLRAQLEPSLDGWIERTRKMAWFRAADGNVCGFSTERELTDAGWAVRFGDAKGSAAGMDLWPNKAKSTGVPAPVVLDGFGAPWALARIYGHYRPLDFGARAALFVAEREPWLALDALAWADLEDVLGDGRLRVFVGEGADQRLAGFMGERLGRWSSLAYLMERPPAGGQEPPLAGLLRGLVERQGAECERLNEANRKTYSGRGAAYWAERYKAGGGAGGSSKPCEPLRFLLVPTRFSTYIKHAAADIAQGLRAAGAEAEVLIEPDDWSEVNGHAIANTIDRLRPDGVLLINYTRSHLKGLLPDGLPVICWVQDAMPHLFKPETGASVTEIDRVVGSVFKEMVTEHGYAAERCMRFGVPASAAKFDRAPRTGGFEFDIVAATNHSEAPSVMRDRVERECSAAGVPEGLTAELCDEVIASVDGWDWGWLAWTLEDAVARAFLARDLSPESPAAARLLRDVAYPLANRVLRRRVLSWSAELAEERGLRFGLFGKGWEDDAELAGCAKGVLEHGDALAEAYNAGVVTLHASAHWVMHQRLYECAMAGGLPAVLRRPEDAAQALRPAREHLRETGASPTACRICDQSSDRTHCVRAMDDPIAAGAVRLVQRLATSAEAERGGRVYDAGATLADGLVPVGAGDLAEAPVVRELDSKAEQLRLIDAVSTSMFASKQELADLVDRAKGDPAWRAAQSSRLAQISRRSFSYEAATAAIPGWMAEGLAESGSASGSIRPQRCTA